MRFEVKADLAAEKLKALKEIDDYANYVRGFFITSTPSQTMVYAEKAKEAELIAADPDISDNLVPHLAMEAIRQGVTKFDVAVEVLTLAQQWRMLSPIIESRRLAAKENVRNAQTYVAVRSFANQDWADILYYAQ